MDGNTEEFELSFNSGCSGCRRECECGRVHFDTYNRYDWEEGELARLEELAAAEPAKYIAHDHSIGVMEMAGLSVVMGCPCKKLVPYERFLRGHAHGIADYLKRRAALMEKDAAPLRDVPAVDDYGWRNMDTAPQDATTVEVMLPDFKTEEAHWACDLSGEEQPPFRGWFAKRGTHYSQVYPMRWKPLPNP